MSSDSPPWEARTSEQPRPLTIALYASAAVAIVGAFQLLMDRVLGLRMPSALLF